MQEYFPVSSPVILSIGKDSIEKREREMESKKMKNEKENDRMGESEWENI